MYSSIAISYGMQCITYSFYYYIVSDVIRHVQFSYYTLSVAVCHLHFHDYIVWDAVSHLKKRANLLSGSFMLVFLSSYHVLQGVRR